MMLFMTVMLLIMRMITVSENNDLDDVDANDDSKGSYH